MEHWPWWLTMTYGLVMGLGLGVLPLVEVNIRRTRRLYEQIWERDEIIEVKNEQIETYGNVMAALEKELQKERIRGLIAVHGRNGIAPELLATLEEE